jgi:hypothetical protein
MLSGFRKTQSSLRFSPAILSRRQSAGHSTFMVVIDVTALRERAHIGRENNVDLYCVQGGSKAPYCLSKAMNVQKTDTSVQNSEQCFRRNAWSVCATRQPHLEDSGSAPQRTQRATGNSSAALYASCGAILMSPIFLKKKAGRSGGGFERPGWRSPPGRRVNLSYMLGLLVPVVGAGWLPPTVLVIKRTSTRRLSARPLEVLFDSTGLSLPRPIT